MGSLDDAMYGVIAPTELVMAIRSMYIKDELTDHRVLKHIKLPSKKEPFRYVGLRCAKRVSSLSAMVCPRKLTFLEATGKRDVYLTDRKERVGFVIIHSVDLSNAPAQAKGTIRARASMCLLFRVQSSCSTVHVYGTLASDPAGNAGGTLASLSAASSLLSVSRVTICAFNKRFQRLLMKRTAEDWTVSTPPGLSRSSSPLSRKRQCTGCGRDALFFSALVACEICHEDVCSSCIMKPKVIFTVSTSKLVRRSVHACTGCVGIVRFQDLSLLCTEHECLGPQLSDRQKVLLCQPESTSRRVFTDTPDTDSEGDI